MLFNSLSFAIFLPLVVGLCCLTTDTPQGYRGGVNTSSGAASRASDRYRILFFEFLRYAVVGGVAFVADFGTLWLTQELFFKSLARGVYVATACGFVVGLAVNYALSLAFVFTQAKDRGRGRSVGAFLVFGVVGLLGLGWTEFGMWVGYDVLGWDYRVVKILVTGAVLMWNYLGRKILIFNGKEEIKQ